MLQVTALHKSFGERKAVDGVSFSVGKGQTLGLIGPNGAGKSTVGIVCTVHVEQLDFMPAASYFIAVAVVFFVTLLVQGFNRRAAVLAW